MTRFLPTAQYGCSDLVWIAAHFSAILLGNHEAGDMVSNGTDKAMRETGSIKAHNDRNVYILGAGFSTEAGLPLIKNFMNRMRDAAAWLEGRQDRKSELTAIESVLDFRLRASAAAYRVPLDVENIEELFSLASASDSTELSDQVTMAIAATLDFCRATALPQRQGRIAVSKIDGPKWDRPQPCNWELSKQHEQRTTGTPGVSVYSCPLYEFYLGMLCGFFNEVESDRRDTIISLNYDTVVEDALWGLDLPFCYADSRWSGRATGLTILHSRSENQSGC